MNKGYFIFIVLIFLSNIIIAQDIILPKGFTSGERKGSCEYISEVQARSNIGITTPPLSPVRSMAEWEELESIVISWALTSIPDLNTLYIEIVKNAKKDSDVIIVCRNPSFVKSLLVSEGVDIDDSIKFVERDLETIWIRDFGPNSCYLNDVDSLVLIDWIYNRPDRPEDDFSSEIISDSLDLPLYVTLEKPYDLVHTGGNYMTDGKGMGFSSNLVLEENGPNGAFGCTEHTEEGVDSIMNAFHGIDRFVKFDSLDYDVIHHLDMHMKLLNEETLVVGRYPEGVADGPQINANIEFLLSNFKTSYGNPFKIIRIDMPPQDGLFPDNGGHYRTYTNALIVNKSILVPTYEQIYDEPALQQWREMMPGYTIVGINSNIIIPANGAIHCITKEIGVSDPLLIQHAAHRDVYDFMPDGYQIDAQIKHRSGIETATLHYKTALEDAYVSVDMQITSLEEQEWTAFIPEQEAGTSIYYYIAAEATSGRTQVRPLPAPEGYFTFEVAQNVANDNLISTGTIMENIFPNPANSITCIPVSTQQSIDVNIEMYDILGRSLATIHAGNIPAGESKYFINALDYSAGVYTIVMKGATGQVAQKLIIE